MEVYVVTELRFCTMQISKLGYYINFHNFGSKLKNQVFLKSVGSGGFEYQISAHLDNFEISASEANF